MAQQEDGELRSGSQASFQALIWIRTRRIQRVETRRKGPLGREVLASTQSEVSASMRSRELNEAGLRKSVDSRGVLPGHRRPYFILGADHGSSCVYGKGGWLWGEPEALENLHREGTSLKGCHCPQGLA